MKVNILTSFLFCIVFLVGCSNEQTFEDFFHQKMKEMHDGEKNYSYSLVHTELNAVREEDGVAVFREHNNHQGEQVYIAYIQKDGDQWDWKQTRGAEWNTPVKWSSMNQAPYIYSGAISDNSITEVYAGEESANIINVEDDKRFWYVISPIKDVKVKVVKKDDSEEFIEEINQEEL
ncbi:hypothetical protein GLW00_11900 [Halobacillus litoralis]|uniref:Uncharacterized protein n=1 Tax=Halobacillus litoralis TaxID=45668 RepID=A0A845FB58_9BACI|nr:hypothetical protein [Halobacillus litoralis]MYL71563.1 hypothetical protein [Halobacillus litoralis]